MSIPQQRLDKGTFGERGMGFAAYPMERGWAILTGPPQHAVNAPGPDAIAFTTQGPLRIEIVDNKNYKGARPIYGASALTPANLTKSLGALTQTFAESRFDTVPRIHQVRNYLQATLGALQSGGRLPKQVKLVVTNFGGRSTDIGPGLKRKGIVFRNLSP
jgi:hypothetical protein